MAQNLEQQAHAFHSRESVGLKNNLDLMRAQPMLPVLALLMVQPIAALRMQGTRRAIIGAAVAATTAPPLAAHARYTEAAINAAASVGIKGKKEATKAAPVEVEMNAAEKKLQVGIVTRPTRTNLVIIILCHDALAILRLSSPVVLPSLFGAAGPGGRNRGEARKGSGL